MRVMISIIYNTLKDMVTDLDTLLSKVLAGARADISHHQSVAHGLDGALHGGDATGAFC